MNLNQKRLVTKSITGWYFHGMSSAEVFSDICQGRDILRLAPNVTDPGDLGRGIYLTSKQHEAKMYGNVLRVRAHVRNALVLDFRPGSNTRDAAQTWLNQMNALYGSPVTGREREMILAEEAWEDAGEIGPPPPVSRVIHADRVAAATAWRNHLLAQGIDGIDAHGWDFGGPLVLFRPEHQIVEIECPRPRRAAKERT